MLNYLLLIGTIYIGILMFFSWRTKKKIKNSTDFMLGGSKIGVAIGLMTFAATLFSTFTLLGMPDFSRIHGVGAWIFLAFSDAVMVFFDFMVWLLFKEKSWKFSLSRNVSITSNLLPKPFCRLPLLCISFFISDSIHSNSN
jgi:SSS family solute:Na+ symporter